MFGSPIRPTALVIATLAAMVMSCDGCPGCKKPKPNYDRTTPVNTINSFRRALEAGRIPKDIPDFFLDSTEVMAWKLRCKEGGCERAKFKIDKVVSEDDYAAKYLVTFTVFGAGNLRVMSGRKMPMTFAFEDGAWYIDRIGTVTEIKLGGPKKPKTDAAPLLDAAARDGSPQDAHDHDAARPK